MPELNVALPEPMPAARSVEILVRRAAAELAAIGVKWRPIAAAHGLDLDAEPADGRFIRTEQENAFLADATRATGDPLFSWRLGAVDPRSYGLPTYASMNAATVGDAMDVAALLIPTLCEALSFHTVLDGDTVTLVYLSTATRTNSLFSLHATLTFYEQVAGPAFRPTRCGIAIDDREHLEAVSKQIQAPVTADLPYAFVSFPRHLLHARIHGADERLAETLRPYWHRTVARIERGHPVRRSRLEGAILQNLHLGRPTLDRLALTLDVGRLRLLADIAAAGGLRTLTDRVRRRLAGQLLDRPDLGFREVARLLGYADPANLSNALRRWNRLAASVA